MSEDDGIKRTFDSGATRDTAEGKLDYRGFLSPLALKRFAEYMHQHRVQSDGTLRDSDNWKRGIPRKEYMSCLFRHFMDFWSLHEDVMEGDIEDSLCALFFNVQGYLHEVLKSRRNLAGE